MSNTQEEVVCIQLAKNHGDIHGQEKKIGSKKIVLGKLTEEQRKEFHNKAVDIIKKGGEELLNLDGKTLIDEVLPQADIQAELGIDSEFVPQLWYIRRAYSIAKYFAQKDDATKNALLEIFVQELHEGNIKESFGGKTTKYKLETTVEELLDLIEDFEELKDELGLEE